MTYEEFTEIAKNPISREDYTKYIEPLYAIDQFEIDDFDKNFCAYVYDKHGLTIFKASIDYCLKIEEQREKLKGTM